MIRRRVLRSTISNYAGKLVALGAGFFLTPFILHSIGPTNYGLWALVGSAVGYGALLDFGISSALIKYVAEYHARAETEQACTLVATALRLYTILGLIVAVVGAAVAPVFPNLFHVPPSARETTTWLVALMALGIGTAIPCTTTSAVLRGLQRFDLANLISSISTAISVAVVVVVLLLHRGLLGLVAANIVVMLAMQAPSIWLIHRIAPELRFGWRGASLRVTRTIISFSTPLFVVQVGSQLQTKTDELVIAAFLPVRVVTPYAIAQKLSGTAQILTDQFMKVLLPLASELHAEHDHGRLRLLYTASTRLTLAIFAPIGCILVILARPLLTAWVGATYAGAAPLVAILTIASFINVSQWPACSVLQAMAQHRPLAFMALGSGVANLALSIALAPRFGLTGVAFGTLIPTAIECLGIVLPYALLVIGVGAGEVLTESVLPALAPVVPMAIALYVVRQVAQPASLLAILGVGGCGLFVYGLGYLGFGARALERQIVREVAIGAIGAVTVRLGAMRAWRGER